jgi:hypothetical protein
MSTTEQLLADLTTATTLLTNAVAVQQIAVNDAVSQFASVINKVNTELNYVDNTSDANKSVSNATTEALSFKQNTLVSGVNISTVNGLSILEGQPLVIERSATSLVSLEYDNRDTLRLEPLLPSILDDSVVVEGIGLLMFVTTQLEPDDDETCFTSLIGQWLLSVPAPDLLDAWATDERHFNDELDEDEVTRLSTSFVGL